MVEIEVEVELGRWGFVLYGGALPGRLWGVRVGWVRFPLAQLYGRDVF